MVLHTVFDVYNICAAEQLGRKPQIFVVVMYLAPNARVSVVGKRFELITKIICSSASKSL